MRIEKVWLREIRMQLLAPFETSFGSTSERRIILVEAQVDGVSGWGEVTAGETPFYSYETTDTAHLILRDFIWPVLRGREFHSAGEISCRLAPIRGHNMAKAGLESAVWDAEAKLKGMPLWKLLGGTREEIPTGVSIGIQREIVQLIGKVEKALAAGYQRIKIKIKPGWDLQPTEALRERFPRIRLMVDANCAYRPEDTALLKEFDRFMLMMIEQPLGWDDLYGHVALQKQLETPVCLDECVHSVATAHEALGLGACRVLNMKLGRVGGHALAKRIHDLCQSQSVPVWCGGMLESGVGRAHNIAMSTLHNFALPGDISASRRYWDRDIVEPEIEVTPKGTIQVPSTPGIGFEPRLDLIEKVTVRHEVLA